MINISIPAIWIAFFGALFGAMLGVALSFWIIKREVQREVRRIENEYKFLLVQAQKAVMMIPKRKTEPPVMASSCQPNNGL